MRLDSLPCICSLFFGDPFPLGHRYRQHIAHVLKNSHHPDSGNSYSPRDLPPVARPAHHRSEGMKPLDNRFEILCSRRLWVYDLDFGKGQIVSIGVRLGLPSDIVERQD